MTDGLIEPRFELTVFFGKQGGTAIISSLKSKDFGFFYFYFTVLFWVKKGSSI